MYALDEWTKEQSDVSGRCWFANEMVKNRLICIHKIPNINKFLQEAA